MSIFQTPYYEYYNITGFSSLLYSCFWWNRSVERLKKCSSSHRSMGFPRDIPRATPSANPHAIPGSDEKSITLSCDQRHCFQTSCLSNNIHCQKTNISLYLFKAAQLDRKVSIKLLRSAVLWTCLESVHRTADLSSFMDTVGKVSIKLLRSAVLWTQKMDIFKGVEKCP